MGNLGGWCWNFGLYGPAWADWPLDGFSEDWADWPGRVGVEMFVVVSMVRTMCLF
jgi:hypothetical protein